jgi:hypothetical protein
MDIDLTSYEASTSPSVGYDVVQAAQDRDRQDHVAVLVGLIWPPQQVGDLPDQIGVGLCHFLDSLPTLTSRQLGSYRVGVTNGAVWAGASPEDGV